jgi:hypothetical protein
MGFGFADSALWIKYERKPAFGWLKNRSNKLNSLKYNNEIITPIYIRASVPAVESWKWIIQQFQPFDPPMSWFESEFGRWDRRSGGNEQRAGGETESEPASVERDRWRKREIAAPSESPLAKTRPGLRISVRARRSHYAITATRSPTDYSHRT